VIRVAPPPERIRFLARQVHCLGERAFFELLLEVRDGADLWRRLERYARLAPYADFIDECGGRFLPSPHLVPAPDEGGDR
jgi:hypothetical protein